MNRLVLIGCIIILFILYKHFTSSSPPVGSLQFFGGANGGYISTSATDTRWYARNSSFTLETWIKFDPTDGPNNANTYSRPLMLSHQADIYGQTVTTEVFGMYIAGNASNRQLHVVLANSSVANCTFPTDNAWHHVAIVGSGGTEISIYIDGQRGANVSIDYDVNLSRISATNKYFFLGSSPQITDPTITNMLGYLTNIRYDSTTALYSGTSFVVPKTLTSTAGTVFMLLATKEEQALLDSSSNNYTFAKGGSGTQPIWNSAHFPA